MTSILKIHSIRGDEEFRWDPAVDDERQRQAKQQFQEARRRQFFAYSRSESGDTDIIYDFDPKAREILMAVPLLGG
jgi:hypothetical protein